MQGTQCPMSYVFSHKVHMLKCWNALEFINFDIMWSEKCFNNNSGSLCFKSIKNWCSQCAEMNGNQWQVGRWIQKLRYSLKMSHFMDCNMQNHWCGCSSSCFQLHSSHNIFMVGEDISHCQLHLSISCTFHKISWDQADMIKKSGMLADSSHTHTAFCFDFQMKLSSDASPSIEQAQ